MVYSQTSSDIRDRFSLLLGLLDMSRAQFAALDGINQQDINNWLKRGKFGDKGIAALRYLAGVQGVAGFSSDWLNSGFGEAPRRVSIDHPREQSEKGSVNHLAPVSISTIRIQYLEGYSSGGPRYAEFPRVLIEANPALLSPAVRVLRNPSDALRGVIELGDLIFVDSSTKRVDVDAIYVYKLAGSSNVKRIQVQPQGALKLVGTHTYEDSIELKTSAELAELEIGGRYLGRCIIET